MVGAVGAGGRAEPPSYGGKKASKELSNLSQKVTSAASGVTLPRNCRELHGSRISNTPPEVCKKVNEAAASRGLSTT